MPPIKTLSAREVLQAAASKSSSKASVVKQRTTRPQTVPPQKKQVSKNSATATQLSATEFIAAASKAKKSSAVKAKSSAKTESKAAQKPTSATTSTRSSVKAAVQATLFGEEVSSPQKPRKTPVQKVGRKSISPIIKPKAAQKIAVSTKAREPIETTKLSASAANDSTTKIVKVKRSRVPKDFAQTYGENIKQRTSEVLPARERKARKTAAEREQRRALMTPDDDILQRLARAQTTTTKVKKMPLRRSKNWQSRCGKCGVVTTFSTVASLCSRCGAIAVRVLD